MNYFPQVNIIRNKVFQRTLLRLQSPKYRSEKKSTILLKNSTGGNPGLNPTTLERVSKGLACRRMYGKHTYDNLAEMIDKVLSEFNIQNKTTLIVTDNSANFVKAFRCLFIIFY